MVEACLALGVTSFAFISILGLLPMGLTVFHSAIDSSIGTQISQKVINDLQETDFSTLAATSTPLRYFDAQGRELANATSAIYEVNVQVSPSMTLPGAQTPNSHLMNVKIQIARNPGQLPMTMDASNSWQDRPGVAMTTFSTAIAGIN